MVVGREAELGSFEEQEITLVEDRQPAVDRLAQGVEVERDDVGIGEVSGGGGEEGDVGGGGAPCSAHVEGEVALGLARAQAGRIHPAREAVRHFEFEIALPATVVDVVVVEVDRSVVVRGLPPVRALSRPRVPGHRARRQVDAATVLARGSDVDDSGAGDLTAKVPGREQRCEPCAFRLVGAEALDGLVVQRPAGKAGPLDLSIEVRGGETRR